MQSRLNRSKGDPHGLSPQQISQLKEAFSLFDKDNDGNISPSELQSMLRALGISPITSSELESLLLDANTSNSGAIDFVEFMHYIGRMTRKLSDAEICSEAWRMIDIHDQGWVSSKELVKVLEAVGEKVSEEEAREMIKRVCHDDSGEKMGWEEFEELMKMKEDGN